MVLDEDIIGALLSPRTKSVMLLGKTDAGKTTLAARLVDILSREGATGLLDLDMGQSRVGPPSTMGLALIEGGFPGWEGVRPEALYFTGAFSPPGNMLPSLTGASVLLNKALPRCRKLIIDTTGFISGPIARSYKQYKIDLLKPDIVLAIDSVGELEHIISPYESMDAPLIIRLRTSPLARGRSASDRAAFREERLKAFFKGSRLFEVNLKKRGLRRTRASGEGSLEGTLISFRDKGGSDISLGVIEKADLDKGSLSVRSPMDPCTEFACVIIGEARAPDGFFGTPEAQAP